MQFNKRKEPRTYQIEELVAIKLTVRNNALLTDLVNLNAQLSGNYFMQ